MSTVTTPWNKYIQLALGFGITALFFYMMAPFMVALLLGAVSSIIFFPVFLRLSKRIPRSLSALLISVSVAIGILLPMVFVLYTSTVKLSATISRIKLPKGGQTVGSIWEIPVIHKTLKAIARFTPLDVNWLDNQLAELLSTIAEKLSQLIGSFLSGMPGLFLAFSIVIISFYFFLVDGARFLRFLSSIAPIQEERANQLYDAFEKSCRGVVLSLLISSLVQAILMWIAFSVTALPNALLMSVMTLIMGMVPVVGSAPIWIGGVIFHFVREANGLGFLMLLFGLFISTSDNIIRPIIMKGHAQMHPLLALVSVFGAVSLVGPTGIFLGPVIAAVFVSFLKILSLELHTTN